MIPFLHAFCKLMPWNYTDIHADILLSVIPQSRNISVGTLVMFTCATSETGLTSFTLTPGMALGNTMEMMLPNGDRQLMLSFIAPSEYRMLTISCVATRVNNMGMLVDITTSTAVLMIQGERLQYTADIYLNTRTSTHAASPLIGSQFFLFYSHMHMNTLVELMYNIV